MQTLSLHYSLLFPDHSWIPWSAPVPWHPFTLLHCIVTSSNNGHYKVMTFSNQVLICKIFYLISQWLSALPRYDYLHHFFFYPSNFVSPSQNILKIQAFFIRLRCPFQHVPWLLQWAMVYITLPSTDTLILDLFFQIHSLNGDLLISPSVNTKTNSLFKFSVYCLHWVLRNILQFRGH